MDAALIWDHWKWFPRTTSQLNCLIAQLYCTHGFSLTFLRRQKSKSRFYSAWATFRFPGNYYDLLLNLWDDKTCAPCSEMIHCHSLEQFHNPFLIKLRQHIWQLKHSMYSGSSTPQPFSSKVSAPFLFFFPFLSF